MEDVPYGRILREGWLIILIAAILGAAGGFGIAKLLPPTYVASSTLMLQVSSPDSSLFERNQFSLARIKTYPALVDSPAVVEGVREDLKLDPAEYGDREIRRMLSAENTQDTVLLVVKAEAGNAELASGMANAAAKYMTDLIETTENAEDGATQYDVTFDQVLPANPPASPASPQVAAITGMGGVLGLAIGGMIAVYRTTTRRHVATIGDVRRASGLPVVGILPRQPRDLDEATTTMLGNLIALGGHGRRAFAIVGDDPVMPGDTVLTSVVQAGASVGRDVVILDLRGTVAPMPGALPSAMRAQAPLNGRILRMPQGLGAREIERITPAVVSALADHHDIVVLLADPHLTGLLGVLDHTGAAIVPVAVHGATTAGDLAAFVSRMRVMRVRPLAVLLTQAGRTGLDSIARTWRAADVVEKVPELPVVDAEGRASAVDEITRFERGQGPTDTTRRAGGSAPRSQQRPNAEASDGPAKPGPITAMLTVPSAAAPQTPAPQTPAPQTPAPQTPAPLERPIARSGVGRPVAPGSVTGRPAPTASAATPPAPIRPASAGAGVAGAGSTDAGQTTPARPAPAPVTPTPVTPGYARSGSTSTAASRTPVSPAPTAQRASAPGGTPAPPPAAEDTATAVITRPRLPEPTKPAIAKPESAQPEIAKPGSGQPETAKAESAKTESVKPESAKTESAKPEPAKPEPAKPEPAKPEPAKSTFTMPELSNAPDAKPDASQPGSASVDPETSTAKSSAQKPSLTKPATAKNSAAKASQKSDGAAHTERTTKTAGDGED